MKTTAPLVKAGMLAVTAALAAGRTRDDIRGEVAVVTGGSRGLGLLLARELARHGCPLVICARDAAELDRAAGQLRAAGAEVTAIACDLTDEASPPRLVDTALERYGRLDIVISNAGIIQVGPVQAAQLSHYEDAVQTMALAPVRLALTALPVMQRQGHGRIVTIASIGGKLAVPHLLPYSTAKFAAVGFSEGLRAELGRGPVTVTTVVPGLMRTGSHLQARFTGQADKEFTWFALGASLPLLSMDAERAARQIIEAVRARRAEIILTPAGQLVSRVAGLAPGLTSEVLHLVQQLTLPAPAGQPAHRTGDGIPGHALNPALARKAFDRLTALGRAAAGRFNERPQPLPGRREPAGWRSGADDLLRGPDPEFFEQVRLAPRPGHELVEVPGVQPPVGVRQRPQGAPACCLAFDAQPEQFQLLEIAERRPGEQPAVEFHPPGFLPRPGGTHLIGADRDTECLHHGDQGGTVLRDLGRQALELAALPVRPMGSRHPVRQLSARGRAREMIVEIDAEHAVPDLPGAGSGGCLCHGPSVPAVCGLLVLPGLGPRHRARAPAALS